MLGLTRLATSSPSGWIQTRQEMQGGIEMGSARVVAASWDNTCSARVKKLMWWCKLVSEATLVHNNGCWWLPLKLLNLLSIVFSVSGMRMQVIDKEGRTAATIEKGYFKLCSHIIFWVYLIKQI